MALGSAPHAVSVEDFGAVCNGSTVDSGAINDAINSLGTEGGEVVFPSRTCVIDAVNAPIRPTRRTRLTLQPGTILKAQANAAAGYQIILVEDVEDVTIEGGIIEGDRHSHTGTIGEWGTGIFVVGSRNVRIMNLTVRSTWGDGIGITGRYPSGDKAALAEDVSVTNVVVDDSRRNGIAVIGARRVRIEGSTISNTQGTAPMAGIDFEADFEDRQNSDLIVSNTTMFGNVISIGSGGTGTSDLTIIGGHYRDRVGFVVGANSHNFRIIGANVHAITGLALGVYAHTVTGLDVSNSYFTAGAPGAIVDMPYSGAQGIFQRNTIESSVNESRALRVLASNVEVYDNKIRIVGSGGFAAVTSQDDWTHHYAQDVRVGGNRYENATSPPKSLCGVQSTNVRRDEFFEGGYARGFNGPTGPQLVLTNNVSSGALGSGGGAVGGGVTVNATISFASANTYGIVPFMQGGGENGCEPGAVDVWISATTSTSFTLSYKNKCVFPQTFSGRWIATR